MKTFVLFFLILMICAGCAKKDANPPQAQTKEDISSNTPSKENVSINKTQTSTENILLAQKPSPRKIPKWTAGNYKGLQLGKSTVKDIKRIFGEPKSIGNPEDGYDNPIQSKIDYAYENESEFNGMTQIIFDKKTGVAKEVWLYVDNFSLKEAIEKFGKDFYEVEFNKKGCSFKEYEEKRNRKFPLSLAYPQKGFYLYVNDKHQVIDIYYVDKCGE